jgi:hypothetical protein
VPNTTKFILDADAAKGVQEFLRLRDAEKKAEEGLAGMTRAARSTEQAVTQSARTSVREYELAERQMSRALPLPRTLGGAFVNRGRNVSGFELTALPSSVLRSPARTIPLAAGGYDTASEHAAAMNSIAMSDLLGRGQVAHEASLGRSSFADHRALIDADSDIKRSVEARGAAADALKTLTFAATAAGTAFGAINAVSERYTEIIERIGAAGVKLESDLTPLLSIGSNAKHTGAIRQQVLSLSGAYGMDTGAVANSMFMLQSNAGNLGGKKQQEIFNAGIGLNRVAGGDLQTELVSITKLWETYGKELGTVELATAKLKVADDEASITTQEMATLLPDVLPAAKLMGISFDEVAASIITATQVMGSNEKTLTSLRNMYLKMGEAQQQGFIHAGSLTDKLHELQKLDPMALEKLFDVRNVGTVAALAEKVDEVTKNIEKMSKVTGSEVMSRFLDRMKDPASRDAGTLKTLDQNLENVDKIRYQIPEMRDIDIRTKAAKLGYESTVDPLEKALSMGSSFWTADAANQSWWNAHNNKGDDYYANQDWVQFGINKMIQDKLNAGDAQSRFDANVMKLQFGTETKTYIDGPQGRHFTDETDAQRFAELSGKMHGHLKYKDFLQLESLEANNPSSAPGFVKQLQAAADKMEKAAIEHAKAAAAQNQAANTMSAGARDVNAHTH